MKVFLSTSYNQKDQIERLYKLLSSNFENFIFVVVESGEAKYYNFSKINNNIEILYTDSSSFWGKSISIGLNSIYSTLEGSNFDLIILNCDVVLNDWKVINRIEEPKTFYTVQDNLVARSGYNIADWYRAAHEYPFNGCNFSEVEKEYVDIVPTRLICIPNYLVKKIKGVIPNYKKLPHYASDFEFTYRIRNILNIKWLIDDSAYIIEDKSTTGVKNASGSFKKRLKLFFNKKSVFNIKDRFWYSFLISKNQTCGKRIGYIISSISKLIVQLYKI